MKIHLTIVCFIILFAKSTYGQFHPHCCQRAEIAEMKMKITADRILKNNKYNIGSNYDIHYYRLEWHINPEVLYIKGAVTSYFKITQDATQIISFELSDNLQVDSILRHGVLVNFTHENTKIEIDLNTVLQTGDVDSVTIFYQGVPGGSGGFSSFTKDYQNGIPIIWTLSQPYGSSDWWPCKNVLNDKIDSVDIIVTTPSQYRVGSNGILIDEMTNGDVKTYHWKHRYPIETYLIAVAVTQYSVYSDYVMLSTGPLEILNYVFPSDSAMAVSQTPDIIPIFHLFDSLFGAYPFHLEKYGHAQFGWGGGMEHQTMSFMGNFGHDLMAHELAHSWFGNAITCGSWSDIWLNEGFATYATALTYEHMFNEQLWYPWKLWTVNFITNEGWGSVYCPDTTNIYRIFNGRLSYYKGAYALHMLRWVVGDDDFYQSVRNYYNDPQLRYGYAKTGDLIAHFEQETGKDLGWFFEQWIYGEGHPAYQIEANVISENQVQVIVKQTQSHPSVSFFTMPLPIRFSNNQQDTVVIFNNTMNNQDTVFQLTFTPTNMFFDPDLWILSRNNNTVLNLSQTEQKPDILLYPNPVSDKLNIDVSIPQSYTVKIVNMEGKIISTHSFRDNTHHIIPLQNLTKGNYIIYISWSNGSYNTIFSKQ